MAGYIRRNVKPMLGCDYVLYEHYMIIFGGCMDRAGCIS